VTDWKRSIKQWPGWLVMACVLAALLVVGVRRANEPRSADERVQSISKRIACPVCDGESVAESRAPSAIQIRNEIESLVDDGQLADNDIVVSIDQRYVEELALLPSSSGVDLLIWVLPTVAGVAGIGGLVVAFSRWRRQTGDAAGPSDADRELVAAALREQADS
jgi:cytochrome c-type biogenesis protein CcmH